jgi:hypothetical protein
MNDKIPGPAFKRVFVPRGFFATVPKIRHGVPPDSSRHKYEDALSLSRDGPASAAMY